MSPSSKWISTANFFNADTTMYCRAYLRGNSKAVFTQKTHMYPRTLESSIATFEIKLNICHYDICYLCIRLAFKNYVCVLVVAGKLL